MSQITSENTFETAITQTLLENGGYTEGTASDYSPELGMFKEEILQFFKSISEHEGRILHVVVNPHVSPKKVVTVFFDRKARRNK